MKRGRVDNSDHGMVPLLGVDVLVLLAQELSDNELLPLRLVSKTWERVGTSDAVWRPRLARLLLLEQFTPGPLPSVPALGKGRGYFAAFLLWRRFAKENSKDLDAVVALSVVCLSLGGKKGAPVIVDEFDRVKNANVSPLPATVLPAGASPALEELLASRGAILQPEPFHVRINFGDERCVVVLTDTVCVDEAFRGIAVTVSDPPRLWRFEFAGFWFLPGDYCADEQEDAWNSIEEPKRAELCDMLGLPHSDFSALNAVLMPQVVANRALQRASLLVDPSDWIIKTVDGVQAPPWSGSSCLERLIKECLTATSIESVDEYVAPIRLNAYLPHDVALDKFRLCSWCFSGTLVLHDQIQVKWVWSVDSEKFYYDQLSASVCAFPSMEEHQVDACKLFAAAHLRLGNVGLFHPAEWTCDDGGDTLDCVLRSLGVDDSRIAFVMQTLHELNQLQPSDML